MPGADIWADLGILPTKDAAAIRRAYAVRLKAVRPEANPQGFARLRAAYERALRDAETPEAVRPTARPAPEPMSATQAKPVAAPPLAEFAEVANCLRRGDALAAAARLAAARDAGTLTLEQDFSLAKQLGWALAQDHTLPAADVQSAAERLGWLTKEATTPWAAALRARLDAEQWLAALRRDAASRWRWVGSAKAIAARTMLGRGKLRAPPVMGRDRTLRRRYGEFLLHGEVVRDQFDHVRIDSLGRLLTRRPGRIGSGLRKAGNRSLSMLAFALILWVMGKIAGELVPGSEDAARGALFIGLVLLPHLLRWVREFRHRPRRRT